MPYPSCPNCQLTISEMARARNFEECPRCSARLGEPGARFARGAFRGQAAARGRSAGGVQRRRGEGTVLLVDDERSVRALTQRLLLRGGYQVLVASSPEEALQVFASDPESIDLLLTDVLMPGMSGLELAERVRELKPGLRILYMSGNPGGVIDPDETLAPGMTFLAKPFQAQTLTAAVQDALGWEDPSARLALPG